MKWSVEVFPVPDADLRDVSVRQKERLRRRIAGLGSNEVPKIVCKPVMQTGYDCLGRPGDVLRTFQD